MMSKRLITKLTKAMYACGIVFLLTGMLLSAVNFPVLAQEEQPEAPTGGEMPDDASAVSTRLVLSHIACTDDNRVEIHFILNNVSTGHTPQGLTYTVNGVQRTISGPTKVSGGAYHYSDYLEPGYYNVTGGQVTIRYWKNGPGGGWRTYTVSLQNPGEYAGEYCAPPMCEWNPSIPADDPNCFEPCEWNAEIPASSDLCFEPCEWNENIPAGDPGCFEPCVWDASIPADDPNCPTACIWNPEIPSTSPDCPDACIWNPEIPSTSPDCPAACEWDANIPANDPGCFERCEWNAEIAADDAACKPPQESFGLSALCKLSQNEGQMQVRNGSTVSYGYTLSLVGGITTFTGTLAAETSETVQVPWNSSSDEWKLEIAGYTYTATVGNALCTPPDEGDFSLTSLCRIDLTTGELRLSNQSGYDFSYTLYLEGGSDSYTGTLTAGSTQDKEVPWYGSGDTWKLEIADHTYSTSIDSIYCEVCEYDSNLPASDPNCKVPQPEIILTGSEQALCDEAGEECVTFTLEVRGLEYGIVIFSTTGTPEGFDHQQIVQQLPVQLQTLLGESLEITSDGIYEITVCGITWPGVGFGFENIDIDVYANAEWAFEGAEAKVEDSATASLYFDNEANECALPDLELVLLDPFCYATDEGYKMAVQMENPTEWDIDYTVTIDGEMSTAKIAAYDLVWLGNLDLDASHTVTVTWGNGELTDMVAKLSSGVCQAPTPEPPDTPAGPPIPVTAVEAPAPVVEGGVLIPVTGVDLGSLSGLGWIKELMMYLGLGMLGMAFIVHSLNKK